MGIQKQKQEQVLKLTQEKHSENNTDLERRLIIKKSDQEASIPRHILAKFLDSKEKKVNHQGKKSSNLYRNTVFKFQENELWMQDTQTGKCESMILYQTK